MLWNKIVEGLNCPESMMGTWIDFLLRVASASVAIVRHLHPRILNGSVVVLSQELQHHKTHRFRCLWVDRVGAVLLLLTISAESEEAPRFSKTRSAEAVAVGCSTVPSFSYC